MSPNTRYHVIVNHILARHYRRYYGNSITAGVRWFRLFSIRYIFQQSLMISNGLTCRQSISAFIAALSSLGLFIGMVGRFLDLFPFALYIVYAHCYYRRMRLRDDIGFSRRHAIPPAQDMARMTRVTGTIRSPRLVAHHGLRGMW